jgi:hypothetical protein
MRQEMPICAAVLVGRIDELAGVFGLATQRHGVAARSAVVGAARLHQSLGHRDIAHPVGRLGQLDQDSVGDRHRLMHDPQGAGPAEPGELQPGGGMALGDIASHVDPAEEERHPAGVLALQRRETVAGLLKAHTKLLRQPVDIVANGPRGAAEAAVGHEQRARRVIAQADEQQLTTGRAAQFGAFDHGGNLVFEGEGGELVGELETASF